MDKLDSKQLEMIKFISQFLGQGLGQTVMLVDTDPDTNIDVINYNETPKTESKVIGVDFRTKRRI